MSASKMYGLEGIGALVELGKKGYKFRYDAAGFIEVLQSDGVTMGNLRMAEPVNASDAATKNFVEVSVANLVDTAPGTLDTLNELAAALGDDPNFATTMTTLIGTKADSTVVDTINQKVGNLTTLTGLPANSTDLGGGYTYVRENAKITEAVQDIESQITTNKNAIDNMDRGCRETAITKESGTAVPFGVAIPADRTIHSVTVKVVEAWDTAATMEVGSSSNTAALATNTFIDLTTTGLYKIDCLEATGINPFQLQTALDHASATTGIAQILVQFC